MNSTSSSVDDARLKVLREFGLVMALALVIISGVLLWRERWTALIPLGLATIFLTLGIFAPQTLNTVERLWMAFAEKLSVVVTYIIVTLTFFLVITPIGVLMRLFRADLLNLKLLPDAETYWIATEENGPGTRHYDPY